MKILANRFLYNKVLLFTTLLFCSCLFADDSNLDYGFSEEENWSDDTEIKSDLLEPINRSVYHFNDFIYLHLFDPVTNVYVNYTPESVRNSLNNFFTNLKYPVRFLSNVLQFKVKEAYHESLKFGINTTMGIFGMHTPSDKYDFLNEIPDEDLGQVLAVWGVPAGPYIMVPILGPSTLRDLSTSIVGREINPIDIRSDNWDSVDSRWIALLNTAEILSLNEEILPRYRGLKKASIDPYTAIRSTYFQQREQEVSQ